METQEYKRELFREWERFYGDLNSVLTYPDKFSFDYICFSSKKTGLPVVWGGVKKVLDKLPRDEKSYKFFKGVDRFWLIPVQSVSQKIVGFILKEVDKKNYYGVKESDFSLIYGFHNFVDYEKGKAIIIVEGFRDCLFFEYIYPYVLGFLGSGVSSEAYELIENMNDNYCIAFDRDEAGRRGAERLKERFNKSLIKYRVVFPGKKDWGEYFRTGESLQEYKEIFKKVFGILKE